MPDNDTLNREYNQLVNDFRALEDEVRRIRRTLEIKEIELKAVLAQSHEISNTDVLTFLPNRRKIIVDLQEEVIRAARYNTPLSISMVDIDHFKQVNDTYGHAAGDETLRAIAARLREQIRHPDTIGRYGGEEFLIVLPNSELSAAQEQASRLCNHIRNLQVEAIKQKLISITVSIGVAQFKYGQENWEQFLHRADTAMYAAKNSGRNRWMAMEE
ncbi:MAG TPA: GGDEF domain-containing protein [Anaerolineales bacterium]|nr:GGDEF domain-containing protein [Anaerolineales bacterium]HNQ94834.1 GGDEF domain-containing protein [Anaerolineales bacterium]HNS60897.1 GGDEF domain-containing protein [Anaerolineales bacterium]